MHTVSVYIRTEKLQLLSLLDYWLTFELIRVLQLMIIVIFPHQKIILLKCAMLASPNN